jgi:hypothetical protein
LSRGNPSTGKAVTGSRLMSGANVECVARTDGC